MSSLAIRVAGLGKEFRIGSRKRGYKTIREAIVGAVDLPLRIVRKLRDRSGAASPTFWALKDVTFDVAAGEVVGIIGRNGAGKSTLLRILSRITEPTEGYAEIRGRVGSLLEVGTGFHTELTGRENVFLNGAILGMRRAEIARKFDEIVAFAEVERFIDTAVKHYSTGMYLRLAFSVAAHLEPDILIVDEVLAVGDARFQKRCLNKMQSVGQQGRTVLFVSHNMPAITRLCERAILLEAGRVVGDGPAPDVVSGYLRSGLGTTSSREWPDSEDCPGRSRGVAGLRAVRVRASDGRLADSVDVRKPVSVEMEFDVFKPGYKLMPHFSFSTEEGITAFSVSDPDPVWRLELCVPGRYRSTVWIPGNFLAEGTTFVAAGVTAIDPPAKQFFVRDVVAFQVVDRFDEVSEQRHFNYFGRHMEGVVRPVLKWNTDRMPVASQRVLG